MIYLTLIFLTVLSCILFEYFKVGETVKLLVNAYKSQFKTMADKSLSDDEKQHQLLQQIRKQIILMARLVLGIFLFIAPFLSLFLLVKIDPAFSPEILVTPLGLLIPVVTVFVYLFIKKRVYGRLFR